jgi:transcriptional regulator with XRE-family HTH domain
MTGKELKGWRQTHDLTQANLAERLGVATNTVYRWESDQRAIPPFLDLALRQIASTKNAPAKRT